MSDEIVKCDLTCLTCASFFEFNIDGETWRKMYVEAGGTEHMANHMWGKFTSEHHMHNILNVIGNADFTQGAIITKMVNQWCKDRPDNPYGPKK